jgi:hypothetical protein
VSWPGGVLVVSWCPGGVLIIAIIAHWPFIINL